MKKYMTHKNISIAVAVIIIIAIALWKLNSTQDRTLEQVVTEETAPTTQEITDEAISAAEEIAKETTSTEEPKKPTVNSNPPLQFAVEPQTQDTPEKIELGPRQPATVSPMAALIFFMEAMQAGDIERAVSYFRADLQDSYRTSFTTQYKNGHPVVRVYALGNIGEVELIDPQSGLYEIPVYLGQSEQAFRLNFMFDSSVQEFVITEL
ncbi:MAG: hypothetical protein JKX80_01650 [Candidatus Pacebacteria bacterium]|nr:hypothetical protein [Candidatus Paceibacterota bacterium]